jgi:hypothetical protein
VGYPKKKDGSKDGRRMCVSCGGRWVDGNDLSGMKLVPPAGSGSGSRSEAMLGGESPRSKARREMYGLGSSVPVAAQSIKGKDKESVSIAQEQEDEYEIEDGEEYLTGLQNASFAAVLLDESCLTNSSTLDPKCKLSSNLIPPTHSLRHYLKHHPP